MTPHEGSIEAQPSLEARIETVAAMIAVPDQFGGVSDLAKETLMECFQTIAALRDALADRDKEIARLKRRHDLLKRAYDRSVAEEQFQRDRAEAAERALSEAQQARLTERLVRPCVVCEQPLAMPPLDAHVECVVHTHDPGENGMLTGPARPRKQEEWAALWERALSAARLWNERYTVQENRAERAEKREADLRAALQSIAIERFERPNNVPSWEVLRDIARAALGEADQERSS